MSSTGIQGQIIGQVWSISSWFISKNWCCCRWLDLFPFNQQLGPLKCLIQRRQAISKVLHHMNSQKCSTDIHCFFLNNNKSFDNCLISTGIKSKSEAVKPQKLRSQNLKKQLLGHLERWTVHFVSQKMSISAAKLHQLLICCSDYAVPDKKSDLVPRRLNDP